jgi:hypothetical protein
MRSGTNDEWRFKVISLVGHFDQFKLGARSEKSESNRETWTFEPTPGDNTRGSEFRTVAGSGMATRRHVFSHYIEETTSRHDVFFTSNFNCQKAYGVNHMLVQYMLCLWKSRCTPLYTHCCCTYIHWSLGILHNLNGLCSIPKHGHVANTECHGM